MPLNFPRLDRIPPLPDFNFSGGGGGGGGGGANQGSQFRFGNNITTLLNEMGALNAMENVVRQLANLGFVQSGRRIQAPELRRAERMFGDQLGTLESNFLRSFLDRLGGPRNPDQTIGPGPRDGVPAPHGGGGGGGGGDGFGFRGEEIPPPFETPQSTLINDLFDQLLTGDQREPRDIQVLDPTTEQQLREGLNRLLNVDASEFLPADLISQIRGTIDTLASGQGYPVEVLDAAQNRIREGLATQERAAIQRRGGDFAGRSFFGSGPAGRASEDIERFFAGQLANELTELGVSNAQAAERARALSLQGGLNLGNLLLGGEGLAANINASGAEGLLGLGRLNLAGESTAIQEALARQGLDLDALRLAISRELGLGQLDLGQSELELQRQLQELMQNLLIQSEFFGAGGGGDLNFEIPFPGGFGTPTGIDLNEIIF